MKSLAFLKDHIGIVALSGLATLILASAGITYALETYSSPLSSSTTVTSAAKFAVTNTNSVPVARIGVPYNFQLQSNVTKGLTVQWSSNFGALPAGLTLSTTGLISGTPIASASSVNFGVLATTSGSATASSDVFSIFVERAPEWTVSTFTPKPEDLNGTVGKSVSITGTAGGYPAPDIAIISGTLPAGLELTVTKSKSLTNFSITGTPTGATTGSTVTFRATNSIGTSETKSYNFVIEKALAITSGNIPGAVIGNAYSNQLANDGRTAVWSIASGNLPAGLALATTGLITGTPTAVVAPGVYTFTVQAKTATNEVAIKQIKLMVVAPLTSPTLIKNQIFTWVLPTSIPNSTWSLKSGVLPKDIVFDTDGFYGVTTVNGSPTTYPVIVRLTNTDGVYADVPTTFVVNEKPTVTSLNSIRVGRGTSMSRQLTATGFPTPTWTYQGTLPAGLTFSSSGLLSGIPTAEYNGSITFVATNAVGTHSAVVFVDIAAQPTVTTSSLPNAIKDEAYSATLTASNAVTWSLFSGTLPAGLTLNASTGAITGTSTTAGVTNFTVSATNSWGSIYKALSITTKLAAPTIIKVTLPNPTKNVAYSQTITTTGEALTFAIASGALPSGLTLNTSTGVISGTPTAEESASFTVSVTNSGGTASQAYSFAVVLSPPVITKTTLANGFKGVAYSQTLGWTGENVSYVVSAGSLPAGLTLNGATGVISGTPTTEVVSPFNIRAINSGGSVAQSFEVTITLAPPVITRTVLANGSQSVPYSEALGWTGENLTYSVSEGALPAGLTLNTSTGVVSGTPTTRGVTPFNIRAVNSGGSVAQSFEVTITVAPPTVTAGAMPFATVGTPYNSTIPSTGESITYTVINGTIPDGTTLNPTTGAITGTPTTSGTANFTIRAVNAGGAVNGVITLQVRDIAPVLTTTALNIPRKGAAFTQTLTATGVGVTWSVTGTLPAGITLSTAGVLSGTPTVYGTFPITVSVTNTGGASTKSFNFVVDPRAPIITTPAGAITNGTVGTPYSFQIVNSTDPGVWAIFSGALPAGLTINTATGLISGTPTTVGSSTFNVIVENSNNDASRTFTMTVNPAPPVITRTTFPNGAKGVAYSQGVTTTGVSVVYSVSSGTLPAGLTLNVSTGVISGTPTGGGVSTFTITATNGGGAVARVFTINIPQMTELVKNGGFESGITNWAWRYAGGDIAVGSSPSNTGSKTGARYARVYDGYLNSDMIAVTPGETVTLKFAYRNVGIIAQSQAYYGLLYSDDFGNEIDVAYKVDASTVWGAKTVNIVIPADYKYAQVYFSGDYAAGATTVYDDVSLTGMR